MKLETKWKILDIKDPVMITIMHIKDLAMELPIRKVHITTKKIGPDTIVVVNLELVSHLFPPPTA